jgi:hypothetical protein
MKIQRELSRDVMRDDGLVEVNGALEQPGGPARDLVKCTRLASVMFRDSPLRAIQRNATRLRVWEIYLRQRKIPQSPWSDACLEATDQARNERI